MDGSPTETAEPDENADPIRHVVAPVLGVAEEPSVEELHKGGAGEAATGPLKQVGRHTTTLPRGGRRVFSKFSARG